MNVETNYKRNKLIVLVGLPRSGKSTFSKNYSGAAIVNRDSIRLTAHGHVFRQEAEPLITFIEETMVKSLMVAGTASIIVDATNTIPVFRNKWRKIARDFNYDIRFHVMKTSVNECIRRAIESDREDLIPVIEKMSQYMSIPDGEYLTSYEFEKEQR